MLQIGDRVAIQGSHESYTLSNPAHLYIGTVIGYDDGNVAIRLDEPVRYRDTDTWYHEVSVQRTSCRKLA